MTKNYLDLLEKANTEAFETYENLSVKEYKNKFKNYPKLFLNQKSFNFLSKNPKVKKYVFKQMPINFLYPGCGIFSLIIDLSRKKTF